MKVTLLLILVLLLFLIAACAEPDNTADSIEDIIGKAEAAHQTAAEQGHAWTKTAQFLASAKDKLANGEEGAAMVDAQRALLTANASVAQAANEEIAWKGRVPK